MKRFLCVICFCLMLPLPALADVITLQASGAVDFVSQTALDPLKGKTMSYTISYSVPAVPDVLTLDQVQAYYNHSLLSFSATLDGQSLISSSGIPVITVQNDSGPSFYDDFEAYGYFTGLNLSFTGIAQTFTSATVYFILRDTSQAVFSDTSLPTSFDLAKFNLPFLSVTLQPGIGSSATRVDATITSFHTVTPTPAPEPATMLLLGLGLMGLAGVRRFKG